MTRARTAALVGGAVLAGGALAGGIYVATPSSSSSTAPPRSLAAAAADTTGNIVPAIELQPGQYIGPCGIVTPPAADHCQAAQGMTRYVFWGSMVNASLFQNWRKANPGEWTRLQAHMAAPQCPNPVGLPQDMITQFGAALFAEVQAYACALGTDTIVPPAPSPPPAAGSKDKTAPTAPGPVQIVPTPAPSA